MVPLPFLKKGNKKKMNKGVCQEYLSNLFQRFYCIQMKPSTELDSQCSVLRITRDNIYTNMIMLLHRRAVTAVCNDV